MSLELGRGTGSRTEKLSEGVSDWASPLFCVRACGPDAVGVARYLVRSAAILWVDLKGQIGPRSL